jgi:hypothetical protein
MLYECAAYKIHHVASLMPTEEGRMFLDGYLNFTKKLTVNQDLIWTLEKTLDYLKIK